jgi:RHS repeat-associated protein
VTDAAASVMQSTQYYPFGTSFADASGTSTQPYKYNGKELDQMHGLNLYDYSARYYESAIGRFTTVDPLAEMYYSWSPYSYVGNNPLRRTDPTGMYWVTTNDQKYADELSKKMTERANSLRGDAQKIADDYVKAYKNGDLEKAGKLLAKGLEVRKSFEDLESGVMELTAMGNDASQGFTYSKTSDNVGGAEKRSDGIIEMRIAGSGNVENGIHESTHGYDMWKGGPNTTSNWDTREIKAYGRQFSYNASSLPNSYWGSINTRSDITPGWVRGAYNEVSTNNSMGRTTMTRDYLYAKWIMQNSSRQYTPVEIEKLLDQRRKAGLP